MNKGASTVFSLQAHLVFVTKYRKPVIDDEINNYLKETFERIGTDHYIKVLAWNYDNVTKDHIHVLIDFSPRTQLSGFMLGYKGVTSRYLQKNFPHIKEVYYGGKFWNRGFFACSVGQNSEDLIRKYIENQGVQKRVRSNKGYFIQSRHKL